MGAKKHEIYVATLGGHLFYGKFLQGQGWPWPLGPLWIRYWSMILFCFAGVGCLWSQVPFLVTGPMSLLLEGGR